MIAFLASHFSLTETNRLSAGCCSGVSLQLSNNVDICRAKNGLHTTNKSTPQKIRKIIKDKEARVGGGGGAGAANLRTCEPVSLVTTQPGFTPVALSLLDRCDVRKGFFSFLYIYTWQQGGADAVSRPSPAGGRLVYAAV